MALDLAHNSDCEESMTHQSSFGIRTPRDFLYEMVVPQYKEFTTKNSSSRRALIATILSYHMYEWVHRKKFTRAHFESNYPSENQKADIFDLARNIANGTKHFVNRAKTHVGAGFSSGFSDGFARPLNIEFPDGTMISADRFLREMVEFWKRQEQLGRIPN